MWWSSKASRSGSLMRDRMALKSPSSVRANLSKLAASNGMVNSSLSSKTRTSDGLNAK
jgi:hypothetical protein